MNGRQNAIQREEAAAEAFVEAVAEGDQAAADEALEQFVEAVEEEAEAEAQSTPGEGDLDDTGATGPL